MQSNTCQNQGHIQGFSLIEMLVALAIFSIILLALLFTEFQSAKTITKDYFQEKSLVAAHNDYETGYK